jgi:co-chaperonin GroES (HSP10)
MTSQNGKKTTVVTSGSTNVDEAVSGSLTDVKVGDHVAVMGSTSGTTVTAQQITDSGTKTLSGPPGGASGQRGTPPSGSNSEQGAPPSGSNGQQGAPPSSGGGPGAGGGRPTAGTVESSTGSTLTIKTSSGSTVTVMTSSSTKVTVVKTGTVSDLKVGDRIVVSGTTTNGTITATTIRTGSAGLGGGPGGGPGTGGGTSQGSGPGGASGNA